MRLLIHNINKTVYGNAMINFEYVQCHALAPTDLNKLTVLIHQPVDSVQAPKISLFSLN